MKITVISVLAIGSRTVLVIAKDEKGNQIHFSSSIKHNWAAGQVREIKGKDLSKDPKYGGGDGTSSLYSEIVPAKAKLTPEEEIANLENELKAKRAALRATAKTAV